MSEIKFKGMGINGEWYFGLLSESRGYKGQPQEGFYISNMTGMPWAYQVRPETVGQYTTLNDKKREEAYTGDILDTPVGKAVIRFGGYSIGSQRFHIGFYLQFKEEEVADVYRKDIGCWLPKSVIIGNIHDQELLQCKPSDEGKV